MGLAGFIRHGSSTTQIHTGVIAPDYHLTKTGTNILRLQGNTTYTAPSNVLQGVLSVEGATVSTPYNVKNTARISAWDKVTDLGATLNFTENGGIKLFPSGGTFVGNLLVTDVTQVNPIVVDIDAASNERTHLILRTRNSVDPILTLGTNNSGHNARIETYGTWNYITTGWGELLDIYDSGRQNISYQLQSPLSHLSGTWYGFQNGVMPPGLSISPTGLITGTTPEVTTDQLFTFDVRAINGATILQHTYTWLVKAPIFEAIPSTTRWYAPPSYAPIQKIDAVIVGGGGGGRQDYGYGGGGAEVTQQVIDIDSGHWVQMNIGNAGGQGGNGQTTTFLKTDTTSTTATGGRGAVNSGNNTGSGLGGACCGSLTTYNNNRNGASGTLIVPQFVANINTHLGYPITTVLRLGAGGGRGTWYGSVGSGGAHGGGRGGRSGSNNVVAGTAGTGSGGGGGTANSGAAGKAGGKGAIYIRY